MAIRGHGTGITGQGAFTVLELLVTLSVAAVLLATGVPALQSFTARQQMKAAISALHYDLLAARSEAVYRGENVVICPGDAASGCSTTADWSRGWIVFPDTNGDRRRQPDEVLLRGVPGFANLAITSSADRAAIRFASDGSAPGSNASIRFCGAGGPEHARRLVVSIIGRIRQAPYPDIDPSACP